MISDPPPQSLGVHNLREEEAQGNDLNDPNHLSNPWVFSILRLGWVGSNTFRNIILFSNKSLQNLYHIKQIKTKLLCLKRGWGEGRGGRAEPLCIVAQDGHCITPRDTIHVEQQFSKCGMRTLAIFKTHP